jgi:hypothetical protein
LPQSHAAPRGNGFGPELLCCDWERYWIEWERMIWPLTNDEGYELMQENGWFLKCDRDPDEEGKIRPTTGPESLL